MASASAAERTILCINRKTLVGPIIPAEHKSVRARARRQLSEKQRAARCRDLFARGETRQTVSKSPHLTSPKAYSAETLLHCGVRTGQSGPNAGFSMKTQGLMLGGACLLALSGPAMAGDGIYIGL